MKKVIFLLIFGINIGLFSQAHATTNMPRYDGFYFTKDNPQNGSGSCLGLRFYSDKIVLRAHIGYFNNQKPTIEKLLTWFNKESKNANIISGNYVISNNKLSFTLKETMVDETGTPSKDFMMLTYLARLNGPMILNFTMTELHNNVQLVTIDKETFYFIPFSLGKK